MPRNVGKTIALVFVAALALAAVGWYVDSQNNDQDTAPKTENTQKTSNDTSRLPEGWVAAKEPSMDITFIHPADWKLTPPSTDSKRLRITSPDYHHQPVRGADLSVQRNAKPQIDGRLITTVDELKPLIASGRVPADSPATNLTISGKPAIRYICGVPQAYCYVVQTDQDFVVIGMLPATDANLKLAQTFVEYLVIK